MSNLKYPYIISVMICLTLFACNSNDESINIYKSKKRTTSTSNSYNETTRPMAYVWPTPKGWIKEAASSMRIASFSVGAADMSVVVLGGRAGSLLMNINRWRDQLGLKELVESKLEKSVKVYKGKLGEFSFIFIKNKKSNTGVLASTFYQNNKTIFLKMKGPLEILNKELSAFLNFSRNIREN